MFAGIKNADVDAAAAIAYSKLNLASSIVTGDIVDGTIVNGDISGSAAITGGKLNFNYGTSLPGSPTDGDLAVLVDSTSSPTYQWLFRYHSGSSNTEKWEFVGGTSLVAEVATSQATGSLGSYLALATGGPTITIPRAGVYTITHGSQITGAVSNTGIYHSFDIGGTGAVDANACAHAQGGVFPGSIMRLQALTVASASTALISKYKSTGANASFGPRFISAVPVRVS